MNFVNHTPRYAAGVGLGVWDDSKKQWWETVAGAKAKVAAAIASGVKELACFRLIPTVNSNERNRQRGVETPASYWWDALEPFMKQGGGN